MKFSPCPSLVFAAVFLLPVFFLNACQAQRPVTVEPPAENNKPLVVNQEQAAEGVGSVSPGSRLTSREADQIVTLHNRIRAEVGVGPLRWSEALAAYAQQWADHLASTRCRMEHRPRSGQWRQQYGENLFIGTAGQYGTPDAVKAWAREKSKFRGGVLQSSRWVDAGHYTQLVWRDTRQVGCATAVCSKKLIVVCNYDPPGNFRGQKPY